MRFVVDASIWIKLLRKEKAVGYRLLSAIENGDDVIVTPVAYYEVMRGLRKRDDEKNIVFISEYWTNLPYVEASREVWDEAVRLWVLCVKKNEKREDADTILAAFASVLDAVIVTADKKHFPAFELPVQNWTITDE